MNRPRILRSLTSAKDSGSKLLRPSHLDTANATNWNRKGQQVPKSCYYHLIVLRPSAMSPGPELQLNVCFQIPQSCAARGVPSKGGSCFNYSNSWWNPVINSEFVVSRPGVRVWGSGVEAVRIQKLGLNESSATSLLRARALTPENNKANFSCLVLARYTVPWNTEVLSMETSPPTRNTLRPTLAPKSTQSGIMKPSSAAPLTPTAAKQTNQNIELLTSRKMKSRSSQVAEVPIA